MSAQFRIQPLALIVLGLAAIGCGDTIATCEESRSCIDPDGEGGAGGEPNHSANTSGDGGGDDKSESGGSGNDPIDPPSKECADGSWNDDDDPDTKCVKWSTCEPGQYLEKSGSPTRDQQCAQCESGTFSDEDNAKECSSFSECPTGILKEGNTTGDFECASKAVDVAVGDGYSCILREEGTVACWGKNDLGQLGSGKSMHSAASVPVMVDGNDGLEPLSEVVQLSAGDSFACAVKDDGRVWCWGSNSDGQLGQSGEALEFSLTALAVPQVKGAVKVATAVDHACALLDDTSMKCWGLNALGAGDDNTDLMVTVLDPADDGSALEGVVDMAVGHYQSCAVLSGGAAYCWGIQAYGEVGIGGFGSSSAIATRSETLAEVEQVAAGTYATCWIHESGGVSCHGSGPFGDSPGENWAPVEMPLFPGNAEPLAAPHLTAIRLDYTARCMLFDDGTVWCWGRNDYGQLGNNTTESSNTLVQVESLSDIVAIDAGYSHACAVDGEGHVSCWGNNAAGEVGNGTVFESGTPIHVPDVTGAVAIESGSNHTCAVLDNGRLTCWGSNLYGQLGIGSDELMSSAVELAGISNVKQFTSEGYASFAVKTDGTIRGWGGDLGGKYDKPSELFDVPDVAMLALGTGFACAVTDDATLKCWGSNTYGESGVVNDGEDVDEPTVVAQDVDSVATGMTHACLLSRGDVKCWGLNIYSQVGRPSDETSSQFGPRLVPGLSDVSAISLGRYFSLALKDNGQVVSFGLNEFGLLGDGEPVNELRSERAAAETVAGVNDAVSVAAGELHSCAVLETGTAMCWGMNEAGQLGHGDRGAPNGLAEPVLGLNDAVAISAGYAHTCALHSDGTVSCWGSNELYQLGRSRTARSLVPVEVIWQ